MVDVLAVAEGRHAPGGSEHDYHRTALDWAGRNARPGESATVALARRIVDLCPVVQVIYRATERAATPIQ